MSCKTVEVETDDGKKSSNKHASNDHNHNDDSSSEEDDDDDDGKGDGKDDEEISSKLISIKQELKLLPAGNFNVDPSELIDDSNVDLFLVWVAAVRNPVRQTLQFVPTASFDKSNEAVSALASKIQGLLKSTNWNEFAAAQFVEVTNELRRMSAADLDAFKANGDIK